MPHGFRGVLHNHSWHRLSHVPPAGQRFTGGLLVFLVATLVDLNYICMQHGPFAGRETDEFL